MKTKTKENIKTRKNEINEKKKLKKELKSRDRRRKRRIESIKKAIFLN